MVGGGCLLENMPHEMARGSSSLLSSHGRVMGPQDDCGHVCLLQGWRVEGEEESKEMLLSDGQPETVERARHHLNASFL